MALRTFGEDGSSSQELPWINDYVVSGGKVGDASFVRNIKRTENGYLILAEDFKGFLFNKSQIARFLGEALEVWVSNSSASFPLYAIAAKGGKLNLAVDDEESLTVWIEETKGRSWEQKRKKGQGSGVPVTKSNPFLPDLTPPSTPKRGTRGKTEDHPDYAMLPH